MLMIFTGKLIDFLRRWVSQEITLTKKWYLLKCGSCQVQNNSAVEPPFSGTSGPGASPGQGHCVVFLGKTLHTQSASLHPDV